LPFFGRWSEIDGEAAITQGVVLARRKASGLSGAAFGILIVVGLVVQAAQHFWLVFLAIGVAALAYWLFKGSNASVTPSQKETTGTARVTVEASPKAVLQSFTIPEKQLAAQNLDQIWLPAGSFITVAGYQLRGGLLYVGRSLQGGNGSRPEAALIDPGLPVTKSDDGYNARKLGYWSSYSEASKDARASYLNWLATGRSDPSADIGYVFLYFYGLEQRALVDATWSEAAKEDIPTIVKEVERLLAIYGRNPSFHRYATSLVNLLRIGPSPAECWGLPPPLSPLGELTFAHRLCLGQMASLRKALPGEWAYTWMRGDPTTRLRTSAQRCPEEFKRAFLERYAHEFGDGMVLPQNKTRLMVSHRPASPSLLQGGAPLEKVFDLPDVTVLSSPMKKLQAIADECMSQLDSYSRFLGRNPDKTGSADALLELPFTLWPAEYRKPIEKLRTTISMAGKPLTTKFEKLHGLFPNGHSASRQHYLSLSRVLSEAGLGIEPDLNFGGQLPSADEAVVVFSDEAVLTFRAPTPEYGAAALALHLGTSVSVADGVVGGEERQLLLHQLEDWLHLPDSGRRRLQAHLRLLLAAPPSLKNLKKRIEDLSLVARRSIGEFLTTVAKADNQVTPAEVKMLEKVFKMLGLDVQFLYGMLHIAAEAPVTVRRAAEGGYGYSIPRPPKQKESALDLDMGRIAALQAESEKISAILGAIFAEEGTQPEPTPEPSEVETVAADSVMGLDTEYTVLVRLLCTRPEWTREELEELAQDRGIMLDGALECLNETAFDKYEQPFCEGDDPVEINQEVIREMLHDHHSS
jgi:uncharacterized tellurite resistance protein B-like protein